jgi:hypothetical protein
MLTAPKAELLRKRASRMIKVRVRIAGATLGRSRPGHRVIQQETAERTELAGISAQIAGFLEFLEGPPLPAVSACHLPGVWNPGGSKGQRGYILDSHGVSVGAAGSRRPQPPARLAQAQPVLTAVGRHRGHDAHALGARRVERSSRQGVAGRVSATYRSVKKTRPFCKRGCFPWPGCGGGGIGLDAPTERRRPSGCCGAAKGPQSRITWEVIRSAGLAGP